MRYENWDEREEYIKAKENKEEIQNRGKKKVGGKKKIERVKTEKVKKE